MRRLISLSCVCIKYEASWALRLVQHWKSGGNGPKVTKSSEPAPWLRGKKQTVRLPFYKVLICHFFYTFLYRLNQILVSVRVAGRLILSPFSTLCRSLCLVRGFHAVRVVGHVQKSTESYCIWPVDLSCCQSRECYAQLMEAITAHFKNPPFAPDCQNVYCTQTYLQIQCDTKM